MRRVGKTAFLGASSLALIACDRSAERPADSAGRRDTTTAAAKPREPVVPQYVEIWVPHWELALQHTESVTVSVTNPTRRCEESGRARLERLIDRRGHWDPQILVTAQVPDDYCDSTAPRVRRSFVWIRYLDARGRPLVAYPSRGC